MILRQIHYQFVARDLYANTKKNYRLLGTTLQDSRNCGLTDWDAIEDRTRTINGSTTWGSPSEIIESSARQYREDLWAGQQYRVEVWIEKDSLLGVIEGVCREHRVAYTATRGNTSQTEAYRAGKRLAEYVEEGLTPVVLHLADHDPTGVDMTRDCENRISRYAGFPIEVRRIALNMDQVRRYRPPPNFVKEKDARTGGYRARFGTDDGWELDALAPDVIADLIRSEIAPLIDQRAWARAERKEAEAKRRLLTLAKEWGRR